MQTTALDLAKRYAVDGQQTQIAGLLHDCARCFSRAKLTEILAVHPGYLDSIEEQIFALWHAPVSALVAQSDFSINTPEIIAAIRYHSTGRAGMTDLEKIIFIADYIEPHRGFEIPETVKQNLNRSLPELTLAVLESKLAYLQARKLLIHPRGIEAKEFLKYAIQTDKRADAHG